MTANAECGEPPEEKHRKLSAPIGFEEHHVRVLYNEVKEQFLEIIPKTEECSKKIPFFRLKSIDVVGEVHHPKEEMSLTEMKDLDIERIPETPVEREAKQKIGFTFSISIDAETTEPRSERQPWLRNGKAKQKQVVTDPKKKRLWLALTMALAGLFITFAAFRVLSFYYESTTTDILDIEEYNGNSTKNGTVVIQQANILGSMRSMNCPPGQIRRVTDMKCVRKFG